MHATGATLGQALVVEGAGAVGVALDDHFALRVFLEELRQFGDVR
jgi:dethiobiotin synthetase